MKKFATAFATLGCLACAPAAIAASTPVVAPHAVTGITVTTAVLNGAVNPNGTHTLYHFDYGPTTALGVLTPAVSAGAGVKAVAAKAKLSGLTPGTTYYYALVATNAAGTSTSTVESFKTAGAPPPTPVTGGVQGVAANQVTLTGSITTQGAPTTYYFQYGFTPLYGLQTSPVTIPASVTAVPVSVTIGGLQPGATFHYRLVATHATLDTGAGADLSFETYPFPVPRGKLQVQTRPGKDTHRPFTFTTSGGITNPASASTADAAACNTAIILITFRQGRHVVATNHTTMGPDCRFTAPATTTIGRLPHVAQRKHGKRRSRPAPVHLSVEVHFLGSPFLWPTETFQTVTVG